MLVLPMTVRVRVRVARAPRFPLGAHQPRRPRQPGFVRVALALWAGLASLPLVASCGNDAPAMVPIDPSKARMPVAEVAELEIRALGVDRFALCPPPGDLGQPWFPQPPPWSPPAAADAGPPEPLDEAFITRTKDRTPTELAVDATHRDFRSCYRRGLVHDATQDGRVAIVLRVGADGHVAKVEEYAACEIATESIGCMKAAAARLRFPPPAGGSDTILIPAVFTSRDGVRKTAGTVNDSYTARAYITMEAARPGLHECEQQARRDLRPVQATGTFTLTLDAQGKVTRAHVDPWTGEQTILACAARELEKLRFATPPNGAGFVITKLNFNPRQGTR
jgi:hypothetical protein